MNMLARNRNRRGFNFELEAPPLEELMKSVFNYFPGFRSDLVFGSPIDSKLEVSVEENSVEVKLPCPGRCKDDIELEVVGDFLTVRVVQCQKHCQNDQEKKRYIIRERSFEEYEESIKLPVPVKGAETKAAYNEGVLHISIPRLMEEKEKTHVVRVD